MTLLWPWTVFPRVQSIKLVCTFLVTHSFGIHPSFALGEILVHFTGNLQILESNLLILIPEREKLKEAFCSAGKEDLHTDVYPLQPIQCHIHETPTYLDFNDRRRKKLRWVCFLQTWGRMDQGSDVGSLLHSRASSITFVPNPTMREQDLLIKSSSEGRWNWGDWLFVFKHSNFSHMSKQAPHHGVYWAQKGRRTWSPNEGLKTKTTDGCTEQWVSMDVLWLLVSHKS